MILFLFACWVIVIATLGVGLAYVGTTVLDRFTMSRYRRWERHLHAYVVENPIMDCCRLCRHVKNHSCHDAYRRES